MISQYLLALFTHFLLLLPTFYSLWIFIQTNDCFLLFICTGVEKVRIHSLESKGKILRFHEWSMCVCISVLSNYRSCSFEGCSKVLTDPSGIITSPNYGPNQKYPGDLACKWTIKAQVGKQINLYFKDFVVEKSRSCRADYLLLYDGDTPKARLIGRYCSARPDPFTSSSNSIHMEFHSDLSLGYRGFFAIYNTSIPATGFSIFHILYYNY